MSRESWTEGQTLKMDFCKISMYAWYIDRLNRWGDGEPKGTGVKNYLSVKICSKEGLPGI